MAEMNDTYDFRNAVLYVLMDNVVTGLTVGCNAVNKILIFCGNIQQCVMVS